MSVSASIDLYLARRKDINISKVRIIQRLLDIGWTFNDYGKVSFLPIGNEDVFDWRREKISKDYLMKILKEKEKKDEIIGVSMTWRETNIGGNFLFMKNGEISVILNINRKLLYNDGSMKTTDVNWYIDKILPAFNQDDILIESFSYEEYV